jgi:hypothetical protein
MMRTRAFENSVWVAFVHPQRCLVINPRATSCPATPSAAASPSSTATPSNSRRVPHRAPAISSNSRSPTAL